MDAVEQMAERGVEKKKSWWSYFKAPEPIKTPTPKRDSKTGKFVSTRKKATR